MDWGNGAVANYVALPVAENPLIASTPSPVLRRGRLARHLTAAGCLHAMTPLREANRYGPGDVMMMADLAAPQPAEIRLCPIGASPVETVCLLMIDPLHLEMAVQRVPVAAFVGVDDGALGDADCTSAALGLRCGTRPEANCRRARE